MTQRGEGWRFWLPVLLLAGMAAGVTYKLVLTHVDPDVEGNNYLFTRKLPGRRGSIFDAFGRNYPLAQSVPVWDYRLDPVALTNRVVRRRGEPPRPREAIVKTIADALKLDYRTVLAMSRNDRNRYQPLALSSDPDAHAVLTNRSLVAGVAIVDRQVRQYTHGRQLCHVLGSVNAESVGSAGVELKYNRALTGVPGEIRGKKDALGHELYDKRITAVDPIPGADIHLTVDHNIQFEVESALSWGVKEYGAGSGWCVVMDAKTGAVLAMASLPDFDPLRYGSARDECKVNRVTNFTYEPGSVMKVITAAAAIDTGFARPDTRYRTNRDDPDYYRLPGDGTHVWEPTMTLTEAVEHSSNIVIGKLGCDLGPERLFTYLRRFGFGERTGIELPGEESGILRDWRKWDKASWSRTAIGQGACSVTALQMASAYQSIANDGLRMRPYIVERVTDASGADLSRHAAGEPCGRTVSESTARTLRRMMLGVASPNGTARRAAIRGYSIAGKTGTAQKVRNGRYLDGLYRATFCGIVPSGTVPGHDPRLVVLVTLDFDARTKFHQGGNSAAPVFRRIATGAIRYLMISPDRPAELEELGDDDELDRIMDERAARRDAVSSGE